MHRRLCRFLAVAAFAGTFSGVSHAGSGWGIMDQAQICNDTEFTISAAYAVFDSALLRSTWRRGGWWTIEPGVCQDVLAMKYLDDAVRFWVTASVITDTQAVLLDGPGSESFCAPDTKFSDTDVDESRMRNCIKGEEVKPFLKDKYWNARFDGGDNSRIVRVAYHVRITAQTSADIRAASAGSPSAPTRAPAAPSRPSVPVARKLVCVPEKLTVLKGRHTTNYRIVAEQNCTAPAGRAVHGCEVFDLKISALTDLGAEFEYADRQPQPNDYVNIVKANGFFERTIESPDRSLRSKGHCTLR